VAQAAPMLFIGLIGFAIAPLLSPTAALVSTPLTCIVLAWMVTRNRIPISSSPLKQPWSCMRHLVVPLLNTWLYTASLAVAALSVEIPLRAWEFDLSNAEQRVATPEGAVQTMALRCADALLVPSDFPLTGYFPEWPNRAFATLIQTPDEAYQLHLMSSYGSHVISMTDSAALGTTTHLEPVAINHLAGCGAIGIMGLETVFAFRALAGVGLKRSLWGSRQGFATVAGHYDPCELPWSC